MPLVKKIHVDPSTQVFVWKITECLEALKTISLKPESLQRLEKMRSEAHQKGFVSIRHLMKVAGYSDDDLYYTKDGKPHLKDGKHVSITHSYDYSALIVSTHCVGVDIEKNRDTVKRIASKFIDSENTFLKEVNLIEQLTVIWGAKESLYKIHPDGGLSFKEHMTIDSFDLKDNTTTGWISRNHLNKCYSIYFHQIEGFSLVYALPKFDRTKEKNA
jgi:4'-phosphopantetheinyl transferase